jgi:hypothetical protein
MRLNPFLPRNATRSFIQKRSITFSDMLANRLASFPLFFLDRLDFEAGRDCTPGWCSLDMNDLNFAGTARLGRTAQRRTARSILMLAVPLQSADPHKRRACLAVVDAEARRERLVDYTLVDHCHWRLQFLGQLCELGRDAEPTGIGIH